MNDILLNYFSPNLTFKNVDSNISTFSNSKKLLSQCGLKLSGNKMTLKLPKIIVNNDKFIENNNNKSTEFLKNNRTEEDINNLDILSKLNISRNNKLFIRNTKKAKSNNKISSIAFENNIMSDLNKSSKINKSFKNDYNSPNYHIIVKENIINPYIKKNKNNNFLENYTERNKNQDKEEKVKEYINILLNDNKSNKITVKNGLFTLNNKKEEEYSLTKSIDPKKYIKNMFLDESYNNDVFKTSKMQLACFNGNEELRKVNIKKINANNMHNLNTNALKIKTNDTPTKLLIDEMFENQKNLNNFYFGKRLYNKIYYKNKNNDNFHNYLKLKNENYNKNVVFTLDDKLRNVIKETKIIEKGFIDRHKSRGKIIRKIRQFCDNYDGIVRRASTYNYKILINNMK